MARRVGRPSSDDAVDTRAAILEQARKSFTAKGFTATTNREIAAAAGITTAAIYHYFPSKIEMYVAVFQDVQEQVYSALERAVDAHESSTWAVAASSSWVACARKRANAASCPTTSICRR